MGMYDLSARFDSRASFYGKAKVRENGNVKELFSYDTKVATIKGDTLTIHGFYSATTRRHLREFARKNGFDYQNLVEGENKKL